MFLDLNYKDALKVAATGCAAAFAGGAFYINVVEHPARMTLDTANARKQWVESFNRARHYQAAFAILGSAAAGTVYFVDAECKNGNLWLVGGGLLFSVLPWTLGVMIADIKKNLKEDIIKTEGETWVRDHLNRWNKQHIMRTLLACAAFDIFLVALLKN